MTVSAIDPAHRVHLPEEWTQELGLQGKVVLEKTADGILIWPAPRLTWDDVFAAKLQIGRPQIDPDEWQGSSDDLLLDS